MKYRPTDYPDADGINSKTVFSVTDGAPQPSIVNQSAVILQSTAEKMNTIEDGTYYVDRTVNNLVVAIPGSDTIAKYADPDNEQLSYGDAVMFTAPLRFFLCQRRRVGQYCGRRKHD